MGKTVTSCGTDSGKRRGPWGRVVVCGLLLCGALVVAGCNDNRQEVTVTVPDKISSVPVEKWRRLAAKKIYFGHQSVGDNIVQGLREILVDHPEIGLNVPEKPQLTIPAVPMFMHAYVGQNEHPDSKNADFADTVANKLGGKVDMAFYKYCFVDVDRTSDVPKLFGQYRETMRQLAAKDPQVLFVHFTLPLMTVQTGWKARVKELLGRPIGGYDDNVRRNQFNDLLRKEYGGKAPVFDLARIESTHANGSRMVFRYLGGEYESLAPEYTRDGGHLNSAGRRLVAQELLLFLADQMTDEGAGTKSGAKTSK